MGRFDTNDMDTKTIGGGTFKFSAKKIDELEADEYTLITVALDRSGSLSGYEQGLEDMLSSIVEACQKSPRGDNMMLRVILFDDDVIELHGFKPVNDITPADYKGSVDIGGMTAAFDAAYSAILASNQYAKDLVNQRYTVNAAAFLITDGADNRSTATPKMVKDALEAGKREEALESMMSVLIGIGFGAESELNNASSYLKDVHDECGFQQYVSAGDASPATLAKIGGFVSKSASSQSQALGTGGPSISLTF